MMPILSWIQAARLPSQSYIFLPLLLGQVFHLASGGAWNWQIFVIVHIFGLFDQLYIVFANDFADYETDKLNQTPTVFSGGSRTLVQGKLQPAHLKQAAISMAALSTLCGLALMVLHGRVWAPLIIVLGLAILWMYSFKPVKLSYAGGGEYLQMAGVGVILPFLGFYAQGGELTGFPWFSMIPFLPMQLSCAMATSLPDGPSDAKSNKRTATVVLGPKKAKLTIILLQLFSVAAFCLWSRLDFNDYRLWILAALPLCATLGQLLLLDAKPGTKKLTVAVALAVGSTLLLTVAMIMVSYWTWPGNR